jgi:hypothetical protein
LGLLTGMSGSNQASIVILRDSTYNLFSRLEHPIYALKRATLS